MGCEEDRCDNDKRLGNERHMLPYLGQDDDRSRNCCNSSFLSTRTIFVGNVGSPEQIVRMKANRILSELLEGPE